MRGGGGGERGGGRVVAEALDFFHLSDRDEGLTGCTGGEMGDPGGDTGGGHLPPLALHPQPHLHCP